MMLALRPSPFALAARSDATIFLNVFARFGNLIVSPGLYMVPSGLSHVFALSGHSLKKSSWRSIVAAVLGRIGKPFSQYSMARADVCSKVIVPHFSSTVRMAWSDPGTTEGSRPEPGMSVSPFALKYSIDAPFGSHPWPTMDVTFFSFTG